MAVQAVQALACVRGRARAGARVHRQAQAGRRAGVPALAPAHDPSPTHVRKMNEENDLHSCTHVRGACTRGLHSLHSPAQPAQASPTGVFGQMAATLTGADSPALPTRAEAKAACFGRAAELLRASGEPVVQPVAQAFVTWLQDGGDLAKLLGAKVGRGRRNDVPHNRRRRQAMVAELRALVDDEHGHIADARLAGRVLALVLAKSPAVVSRIRELSGVAYVPTSEKSLVSLLRGTKS